jgi:hypothetical protein
MLLKVVVIVNTDHICYQELLKHTSVEHPDHALLVCAQKELHELAVKINRVEQQSGVSEQMQQRLREIEAIVDGLDDLVAIDRIFHRYDLVTVVGESGKKERCLFLMSDQMVVTSVKRKSTGALRKVSSHALLVFILIIISNC